MFRLLKSIRKYWTPSILTILFMVGEAALESLIPYITADLVNNLGNGVVDMSYLLRVGALLSTIALASLFCGGMGGYTAAMASTGFAKNIRGDLMRKIQTFTFHNIDKFSTSSLVTRMTTDVSNVQMAYMMIIRIAVRAPLMLAFSIVMAIIMGGKLALAFVIIVPFLAFGLILIAVFAMPSFKKVFKRYDKLNESVEENVRGMRVVKGFSREEYAKEKFFHASDSIRKEFTRAEKIVSLNAPLMQFCLNFNMIFVLYIGAKLAISSQGTVVDVGQVSAMLTYGINYPASLTYHCMDRALQSEVVKAQMREPETDVITGKAFGDTEHRTLDMASLFTVDEDAMKEAFSFDMDDLDMDFSGAFSGMDFTDLLSESDFELAVPEMDFASMLSRVQVNLSPDSMENLVSELMTAYTDFSENDPATSWSELPDSLQEYLETDEANAAISDAVSDLTQLYLSRTITEDEMRAFAGKILLGYQEYLKEQEVTDPEEANNLIDEYLASEQGTEAIREAVTALLQRAAETVVTPEELAPLREALLSGYETWAEENNAPRLSKMRESFRAFLETDQAAQIIRSAAEQAIDTSGLQTTLSRTIGGFVGSVSIQVSEMLTNAITAVSEKITGEMPKMTLKPNPAPPTLPILKARPPIT